MSILEEVIKALESVVAPELKAMNEKIDSYHRENLLRFDSINARFDSLLERLALERRLAAVEQDRDKVGDVLISTVFLALDMGMNHLPFDCAGLQYAPVLWETMVFGGRHDSYQVRYTSKEAALEGHAQAVKMVLQVR